MFVQPSSISYLHNKKKVHLFCALKIPTLNECSILKHKKFLKISPGLAFLMMKAHRLAAPMRPTISLNAPTSMKNNALILKKKKQFIAVSALKKNLKKNDCASKHLNYLHA